MSTEPRLVQGLTGAKSSAHADVMGMLSDLDQAIDADDLDVALRATARLRHLAEQIEADRVARARGEGWSWQEIAGRLGVTKQTLHRKYRHLEAEPHVRR